MTPQQIHLVRSTFATAVQDSAALAASFYRHLFERDPTLRPMFRGDLGAQGRKLMQAIGMVVGALERFETLEPALRDLGRRHALYGVCDRHYDEVAAALLATLADGLGDRFTPAVGDAWSRAYALVAAAMKSGAQVLQQSPPERHVAPACSQ